MIRPARPSDAEAICGIWNPVITDSLATFNAQPKTPDDILALFDARRTAGEALLVCQPGADVIGFGTYGPFRGGVGYTRTKEHTIYLAPEARGQGAGSALLAALEDHAAAAGNHSLWAGISAENPQSVTFHAARGYREIARLPEVGFKFGRWIDLILMQKLLT